MSRPLNQSDLIFPTQALSISSTLTSLKRSALSTHNRLSSIKSDAEFVASVSEAFGLPLVANERCGSWYIPPEKKAESVYFKSTDGHTNEWKFSLRRLNLQLLDLVGNRGGCVIVDSTRRGKSMPDALSKTVPIWCCVINHALFADTEAHRLHTQPQAVSASEHAQIENRIKGFVCDFLDICKPDVGLLRSKIDKPLRPIWVTQKSSLPEQPPFFSEFHPVILCTASRRVNGAEGSEGGYVQGAADDHEAWSKGLLPTLFWSNMDQLLNTKEEDLPGLIAQLIRDENRPAATPILIKPTSNLYISSSQDMDISHFDVIINCGPKPLPGQVTEPPKPQGQKHHLWLECQTGKNGSRNLRDQLWRLRILEDWLGPEPTAAKILVCDPTGKDLAVGVVLAILSNYSSPEGVLAFSSRFDDDTKIALRPQPDKRLIKERLSWITTTHPTLSPPRETLKSVNAYLMSTNGEQARQNQKYKSHEGDSSNDRILTFGARKPAKATTHLPPDTHARIFTALRNKGRPWKLSRQLTSKLESHPSGTVQGTATFTLLKTDPPTLLYAEEGEFETTTGLRFTVRRKYIYILRQEDDSSHISVYFSEEGKDVGALFVEMGDLAALGDASSTLTAQNKEQHLCGQDLYSASWRFSQAMLQERSQWGELRSYWMLRYDVKGPKKDYVSETTYT
ncbi:hypothetical protein BU23DRAFT_555241 [Bimuria novae-zelandiae CBS 107.79]|uniref:Initiator tRNA phosphoribosyl transferase n=1 Tax=Bimuria novae-zelandiae CBS 107.79 TaxID=1447943 RepID=A0A6A5VB10_9PLEO|nr:hypothetical protein BU23DRAFT_555241 [Bimuria novae-zelandiae CBS 107.79]